MRNKLTNTVHIAVLATLLTASAAFGQVTTITNRAVKPTSTARWNALSKLETGNDDYAQGKDGEVSRWQILKSEWRATTDRPVSEATNSAVALGVCERKMNARIKKFKKQHGRQPNSKEWSLLWHCPSHVDSPRPDEADYATRFANLLK